MDWQAAQARERAYHTEQVDANWPTVEQRRAEDARLRRWYAGLLNISRDITGSVTDYGCGPESLLLDHPRSGSIAVDPLTFTPTDEARYAVAGITRIVSAAEDYDGLPTMEGWMYNCLQHVRDWRLSLQVAARHTARTFRLFEWVEQPTSVVHLHTLKTDDLREVLRCEGFSERWRVDGSAERVGVWGQTFYAGVWER